jgi:anti-sigma factor RsiW
VSDLPLTVVSDNDLHAFMDGELPAERSAEVERWLAENPSDAARVRAWRTNDRALGSLYADVMREPVPERLCPVTMARRRRHRVLRIAAAVALFAVGLEAGWLARGYSTPEREAGMFTAQAILAHRVYTNENRHAVEVPADQEAHLVAWLSKRLDHPLPVPVLESAGFMLVGGRLLPTNAPGLAAQYMYEDSDGRRLTLYATREPGGGKTAFRYENHGNVGAFYWMDDDIAYALIGEVNRDSLLSLANAAYDQFGR